ncbi:MAG: HEAT repeat domain-containing protein [Elusimicrobiota bacterium]
MRKTAVYIINTVFLIMISSVICFASDFPLLRDENPVVRSSEARRLGSEKVKEAVPELIDALSDEVPGVRINAIVALGEIEDERAVEPLMDILDEDKLPAARAMAAEALSGFEESRVKNNLLKAAENKDENIRISAMKSLGRSGGEDEVDELIRIAGNDPAGPVREAAAQALGKIAVREENVKDRAKDALRNISKHDSSEKVKNSAGTAIEKIEKSSPDQRGRKFWLF